MRGNTVLAMPEDGGMIRVDEETGLGVALATDGNGRYTLLDPYAGAQLALAEAYRNVAATGARPLAVTNCLNFGSPEDPAVMWQFAEAVRGLADGCATLGIPVTGGNVSFYNQTGSTAIQPTPVIGVLGVHDDVRQRLSIGFATEGAPIVLLGRTGDEFGGSAWAQVVHGHLGGRPPRVDLAAEQALAGLLADAAAAGVLVAAHDLSDGGLAQALTESCLRGGLGAGSSCPATRSRPCSASRPPGPWSRCDPAPRRSSPGCAPSGACPRRRSARSAAPPWTWPAASRSRWTSWPVRTAARCPPSSGWRSTAPAVTS